MEIQALININLNIGPSTNVTDILNEIRRQPGVQWASLVFGPNADAVAYVIADSQNALAGVAVNINGIAGVRGTSTQVLASV